jgi:exopolyphosphatase/pppGpp-phosphohydrolase
MSGARKPDELQRLTEALAEFKRRLDQVDYNLTLIEATNAAWRGDNLPIKNGHLQ